MSKERIIRSYSVADYQVTREALRKILAPLEVSVFPPLGVDLYTDLCVQIARVVGREPVYDMRTINAILQAYKTNFIIEYGQGSFGRAPVFKVIDMSRCHSMNDNKRIAIYASIASRMGNVQPKERKVLNSSIYGTTGSKRKLRNRKRFHR